MARLLINYIPITKARGTYFLQICLYWGTALLPMQSLIDSSDVLKGLLHYLSTSKLNRFWDKWPSAYDPVCVMQSCSISIMGTCQECRVSGPTPELLGQNLHLKRPPMICVHQVLERSLRRLTSRTIEPSVSKSNWNQPYEPISHHTSLGSTFHS